MPKVRELVVGWKVRAQNQGFPKQNVVYSNPLLSAVLFSIVLIAHSQPWSKKMENSGNEQFHKF